MNLSHTRFYARATGHQIQWINKVLNKSHSPFSYGKWEWVKEGLDVNKKALCMSKLSSVFFCFLSIAAELVVLKWEWDELVGWKKLQIVSIESKLKTKKKQKNFHESRLAAVLVYTWVLFARWMKIKHFRFSRFFFVVSCAHVFAPSVALSSLTFYFLGFFPRSHSCSLLVIVSSPEKKSNLFGTKIWWCGVFRRKMRDRVKPKLDVLCVYRKKNSIKISTQTKSKLFSIPSTRLFSRTRCLKHANLRGWKSHFVLKFQRA